MKTEYKSEVDKMTVFLSGEIDHHRAKRISQDVDTKIAIFKPKTVFLDFSDVSFMDSSGLGVLIGRYKAISAVGGKAAIISPSVTAKRLITLAGLHKIIPIYDTIEEAMGGAV